MATIKRPLTKGQKQINAQRDFLLNGLGKLDQRAGSGGDVWWRDRVLFHENTACWRVIDLPHRDSKRHAVLTRYYTLGSKAYPGVLEHYRVLAVPDIAVFSRYEGDMLGDDGLTHRLRFTWLRQMQWHVDVTAARYNGKQLYERNGKVATALRDELDRMIECYHAYEMAVMPGWDSLPNYRCKLDELISHKVGAYRDPDAIRRRERAKARAKALEALGLDGSVEAA